MMKCNYWYLLIVLLGFALLASCITVETGNDSASVNTNVTPIVLNETSKPQQQSQPNNQSAQEQQDVPQEPQDPTKTPLPCNNAKFIAENIPDDKQYDPGDPFTKTWTMRNDGSCTWDETYRVVFNEGDRMNGETSYYLDREVKPGETIDLSVHLTAPNDAGKYKGYWNIKAPDGDLFTYFWAQIEVVDNTPPFAITSVTNDLNASYTTGCPLEIPLKVFFTANGPGTIRYRVETSDLGMQAQDSIVFSAATTKSENFTWTITFSSNYWIKIHVDEPSQQTFGPFNFSVTCQ